MSWPGMDTGIRCQRRVTTSAAAESALRLPRPTRLLYTSRPVTIMANCVPCLFRKTGPGTGLRLGASIRRDRLCVVSLQVRAVVAGDTPHQAGQSRRCCAPFAFIVPDDLRYVC
jgi:hypothetical protein